MTPSSERYRELLVGLTDAKKGYAAAEHDKGRLLQGCKALEHVIRYLVSDPEVRAARLIRPLGFVEKALFNAGHGAKPPELNHKPDGPKPTGTTREYTHVVFAWALELLVRSGMGTVRAAQWVAEEARKAGLCDPNGSTVKWRQIDQWRKDLRRDKGSSTMLASWEDWQRHPGSPHATLLKLPRSDPRKRPGAQQAVQVMFRALADTDPRGAPSARSG